MDVMRKAPELNYMTQFVFMLFEDVRKPEGSMDKYHVDIHFSPGIKGRRELIFEGSNALLKKSSPELPEKSPQVFVQRLSHISVVGSSEAMKINPDATFGTQKKALAGSNTLLKKSSPELPDHGHFFVQRLPHTRITSETGAIVQDNSALVGGLVKHSSADNGGTVWDDLSSRYVTCSRSNAVNRLLLADSRGRKTSAPNIFESLRSASDTKLVDRAKIEQIVEEGQGHTRRKKSASDSLLEPRLKEISFRIESSSLRSKSDGDMTNDLESLSHMSSSSSSPDLNRKENLASHDKKSSLHHDSDERVKKLSLPSMSSNKTKHGHSSKHAHSDPSSVQCSSSLHSAPAAKSPKKKKTPPLSTASKEHHHHHHHHSSSSSSSKKPNASRKMHLSVEYPKERSQSLTPATISENVELDLKKKWGSIEQLREYPNELDMDSQKSMVERGKTQNYY